MILIVDDEEMVCSVMTQMISLLGEKSISVPGGLRAVLLLAREPKINLILLDLNMPDMDGIETLSLIRVIKPTIPVIMFTGYDKQGSQQRVGNDENLYWLAKPFHYKELGDIICGIR